MIRRIFYPSRSEFRPGASGVRAVLLALALGALINGCTPVGMASPEVRRASPSVPSIEGGQLPSGMADEAARALREARSRLVSGNLEGARTSALDVIERFPAAPGSGEALEILARAFLGLGDTAGAVDAAQRYLELLDRAHPAGPGAQLLLSQALAQNADTELSFGNLLQLPENMGADTRDGALELTREIIGDIGIEGLREAAEGLGPRHPLRGVVLTELAVALFLQGEVSESERWAGAALEGDLGPREGELCRAVLGGNLEEVLGQSIVLGAILPLSGVSPGLMGYGQEVLEGIQVAVEEVQGELRRPIRLELFDHGGEAQGGEEAVLKLEESNALGAVGPLTVDVLRGAAAARRSGLPLMSPFASLPLAEAAGVLSLTGPDPAGARVVADYAWDLGLERIVILRPRTEEAGIEGRAFQDEFESRGGSIAREIVFDPGATFFQAEFDQVGRVLPDGLFLPLTARDIQLIAPQFTYYGLDTLGIQLLGTSGWTQDEVVLEVDSRHTDGVIASTTRMSQEETDAYRRFRLRYEDHFQKTLRSRVPAYGYDAAMLLLQALRSSPRNSAEVLEALDEVDDFPGATGHLTIQDGQVIRLPQLARIQNHELIYITPHIH